MPPLGFTQYGGKASTTEIETLVDPSGHSHFGAVPRNPITLTEDPHTASAVIDFENSGAERTERAHNLSGNRHFLAGITSGIAINVRNGGSLRAPRKQQGAQSDQNCRKNPSTHFEHTLLLRREWTQILPLLLDAKADFGDGPHQPTIMAHLVTQVPKAEFESPLFSGRLIRFAP